MHRKSQRKSNQRRQAPQGFSLLEVLVAMVLLVVVVSGLLPLFSRSVLENVEGREITKSGSLGRSQTEELHQMFFNNWELEIQNGSVRTTQDYWNQGLADKVGDESWVTTVPVGSVALWSRTVDVRQFGINGVDDTDLDGIVDVILGLEDLLDPNDVDGDGNTAEPDGVFDNTLAAGTNASAIHLKQVVVEVESQKVWGSSGPAAETTLRAIKAF